MSLRQRNRKWVWDFYPNGANGKRVRSTLPASITTKEQAEKHINQLRNDVRSYYGIIHKNAADKIIWLSESKIEALLSSALNTLKPVTTDKSYKDLSKLSKNIVRFLIEKKIPYFQIIDPTPTLIMEFISYRESVASKNTINKELYTFKKLHDGLVYLGHAEPLGFEISRLYLKEKRDNKFFSEKFFEVLIEKYPKHFLGEDLVFIETPSQIQRLIPDSLFASKDGAYVVLEIQKGALDRNHAYKLLDYRDKVESRLSQPDKPVIVRMMVVVIGDCCSIERKLFLDKYKIELKLLPIAEIEKKILTLLQI